MIIAQVDGQAEQAKDAVLNLEGVVGVDAAGSDVIIQASNGAAVISSVALALNERRVEVREIILRTPTLDDVFLSVAGARMEEEAEDEDSTTG